MVDVGTGDGQLAGWLAARGHRVIATEAGRGPTLRAAERLSSAVELRQGSGLEVLTPGEVEVAVLAGMGGRRILAILAAAPEVVRCLELAVLQPMQHLAELRAGLAGLGLQVVGEAEQVERGRRYTVLLVSWRLNGTG